MSGATGSLSTQGGQRVGRKGVPLWLLLFVLVYGVTFNVLWFLRNPNNSDPATSVRLLVDTDVAVSVERVDRHLVILKAVRKEHP